MRPRSAALVFALAVASVASPVRAEPGIALDDAPSAAPPPLAPVAPLAPLASAPPRDPWRPLRFTSGVSLTGIGALALVTSGILGGRALVSKADIGGHCNAAKKCDLIGYTLASEAEDFALTSTIMFVIGVGAAAAGVPLLVSGRPQGPGPTVGFSQSGLDVRW
jgi:hypothetical protein